MTETIYEEIEMDLSNLFFLLFANTLLAGLVFYLQAKEERLSFLSAKTQEQPTRPGKRRLNPDTGGELP